MRKGAYFIYIYKRGDAGLKSETSMYSPSCVIFQQVTSLITKQHTIKYCQRRIKQSLPHITAKCPVNEY